jgi:hypothetical protein
MSHPREEGMSRCTAWGRGVLLVAGLLGGCGASDAAQAKRKAQPDAGATVEPASKVDLLLVIDNSANMQPKIDRFAASVGTLLREVARVGDVHVGVLTSSLGNFGGDVCDPANPEANGRAYLRDTGPSGEKIPAAEGGFLRFTVGDVDGFVADTEALVRGVSAVGCGFEAQLETMYRFLVQPDPWTSIGRDANEQADLGQGVDVTLLAQRKAFLRPDSALVVVMLTDEDDSSPDPLAIGGQGWSFATKRFPGSRVVRNGQESFGTTAPRGTSACASDPASPDCKSCNLQWSCEATDVACQSLRSDPACRTAGAPSSSGQGYDGYLGPKEDSLNVRFHRMKERFGVDPQFPIARYVDGLTNPQVPDRTTEHPSTSRPGGGRLIEPYVGTPRCTNPIFAKRLPSKEGDELCDLPRGSRSPELVSYTVIAGVPDSLVGASPSWTRILGRDPDRFDLDGIDPHMIQSIAPRAGLPPPSIRGDNGRDPIHGREWDTDNDDLQYACTFDLPVPITCIDFDASCPCTPSDPRSPPLCAGSGSGTQLRSAAYPSRRPLLLAHALGERGVIGSACAPSYDETLKDLAGKLAPTLAPRD